MMTSNKPPRSICAILVDRANYGRMKPVMQAIVERPELRLDVLVGGTMVLERFQRSVDIVRRDGFSVVGEVYMELEGSTPTTMAKSIGLGVIEFANELQRLKPDIVMLIGDRYEALAAAIAAAYMNLPLFHIQGGEVSGSIDESARHAISKFAQFHAPATARAAEYLVRMGEDPATILSVGCPSSDLARELDGYIDPATANSRGSGVVIDVNRPFLLVVFHPTTTEFGAAADQVNELLVALHQVKAPTLMLWPNIDAGGDHIAKAIRVFRDHHGPSWLRLITNLAPEDYLRVLNAAACAVGNSSSFVRDGSFFGTPVVLIGNRQHGRERDVHVSQVPTKAAAIERAIETQLAHGRYAASTLYGDGEVSQRIATALVELKTYTQKRLHYVAQNVGEEG